MTGALEPVKNWLLGIICAALLAALAEGLTPDGTTRKICRMTCGLVVLLAVVQPVIQVDPAAIGQAFLDNRAAWNGASLDLEQTNGQLMETIIARQTGAYILDKATALGIPGPLTVTVSAQTREGEEYPIPVSVEIRGELTREQQAALTRQITADLALPSEQQVYLRQEE